MFVICLIQMYIQKKSVQIYYYNFICIFVLTCFDGSVAVITWTFWQKLRNTVDQAGYNQLYCLWDFFALCINLFVFFFLSRN